MQYNGRKKDIQYNGRKKKDKKINNVRQNTTQKTKDWVTQTQLRTEGTSGAPEW
jgi:hypothetical protein